MTATPIVRTKAEAVARIKAHRAALLDKAANTLALADTVAGYGDHAAADELVAEARAFFAEAERFAPTAA